MNPLVHALQDGAIILDAVSQPSFWHADVKLTLGSCVGCPCGSFRSTLFCCQTGLLLPEQIYTCELVDFFWPRQTFSLILEALGHYGGVLKVMP